MNNYKLRILFVIANNRSRKDGAVPLFCRLTYNKKRKQFATGQFIYPELWNNTHQLVKPPNDENNNINTQLSLIKSKINRAFLLLQVKELDFDVDDIYNQFVGKSTAAEKTLLDAFDYHINRMQELVGIDVKQVSVDKYKQSLKHVRTFLIYKFKKRDYLLNDFEHYLKVEKLFKPNMYIKHYKGLEGL